MSSENFDSVAAYQDYVQKFKFDLISKMFLTAKTLSMVTPYEGIKGRLILTEVVVGDLIKRYTKSFSSDPDKIEYKPRILEVVDASVELSVCPKDLEANYLGELRQKGQDPRDWPFQRFIIDKILAKMQAEQEIGIWSATATGAPTDADLLIQLFDGYTKIIQDGVTAGDLTPTVTGTIDQTNAVQKVEDVWKGLSSAYKGLPTDIFMTEQGRANYFLNYRDRFTTSVGPMGTDGSYKLDFANAFIHGMPGIQNDNTVIITPRTNLVWGYDAPHDDETINFDWVKRELDMFIDFKIGPQIAILEDGVMSVNDQV